MSWLRAIAVLAFVLTGFGRPGSAMDVGVDVSAISKARVSAFEIVAAMVGSVGDTAVLAVDPLRAGEASGTAVGNGESAGGVALAVGQDALRVAGLVGLGSTRMGSYCCVDP